MRKRYITALVLLVTFGAVLLMPLCVFAQEQTTDIWGYNGPVPVPDITGNFMFDFFFGLVALMGMLSFAVSALVKIISRS